MIKKYIIVLSVCLLTLTATSVYAQGGSGPTGPGACTGSNCIENPFKGTGDGSLTELFTAIIDNIILPIGGIVAVLAFIWTGFMFVTAQGDPTKITTARSALLYTAIGTAVLLGVGAISKVLETTLTQLST